MIRGRLTPEAGTLLVQALDAARETLYQRTRRAAETSPDDSATAAPTRAQQHADALVMLAETALHQALDPGGDKSLRGTVPAPGLRCEPGPDAARSGRAGGRDRRPHPHDSPRAAARATPSRPDVSLPGLRGAGRRGPPCAALGEQRPDHADQLDPALPGAIIARCTRRATRSNTVRRAPSDSADRTAGSYPPCPGRDAFRMIRSRHYELRAARKRRASTRARRVRALPAHELPE